MRPMACFSERAQIPSGPEGRDPQLRGRIYARSLFQHALTSVLANRAGSIYALEHPEVQRQNKTSNQKPSFREGSKAAQVYGLLCRPEGATLREIQQATGWQPHSVRGFLSASIRKQGRTVRSFQRAGERVYRVKS
jgi:hypothetical protein